MIITNHRVRGAGWGRGGRGRSGAPGGPCRPAAANPRSFPGLDQTAARPPAAAFRFLPFPLADTPHRALRTQHREIMGRWALMDTHFIHDTENIVTCRHEHNFSIPNTKRPLTVPPGWCGHDGSVPVSPRGLCKMGAILSSRAKL